MKSLTLSCSMLMVLLSMNVKSSQTSVPDNVVWTPPTKTLWIGDKNVELTCVFQGNPYAVYWMKATSSSSNKEIVTWYQGEVSYGEGIDDSQFGINGSTFSLIFVAPKESDAGKYICRVSNHHGFLIYNHTDVTVLDPQNVIAYTKTNVKTWKGSEEFLPCDFRGTADKVIWNKVTGTGEYQLLKSVLTYSENSYDVGADTRFSWGLSFSLHLENIEVSDEANYTCQIWKQDGTELQNSTFLSVNARPEEPYVQIAQCGHHDGEGICAHNITEDNESFTLVCSVLGAKPMVDKLWWSETASGRTINDTEQVHEPQSDGTYNSKVSMTAKLSSITDGTGFNCTAHGVAVDNVAHQDVVIRIVPAVVSIKQPPTGGMSAGGKAAISLFVIVLIIVVAIGVFIYLYRNQKPKLERVLPQKFLDYFAFLNEDSNIVTGVEDEPLVDRLAQELDMKRREILDYDPSTCSKSGFLFAPDTIFNLGVYGVMSAGKSAFINSLNFAIKGEYKSVAPEYLAHREGGHTAYRNVVPLANRVRVVDTRGLRDYSKENVKHLLDGIRGELGQDGKTKVKDRKPVHCPVFVFNLRDKNSKEGIPFLKIFSEDVYKELGRYPLIVLTHKGVQKRNEEMLIEQEERWADTKTGIEVQESASGDVDKESAKAKERTKQPVKNKKEENQNKDEVEATGSGRQDEEREKVDGAKHMDVREGENNERMTDPNTMIERQEEKGKDVKSEEVENEDGDQPLPGGEKRKKGKPDKSRKGILRRGIGKKQRKQKDKDERGEGHCEMKATVVGEGTKLEEKGEEAPDHGVDQQEQTADERKADGGERKEVNEEGTDANQQEIKEEISVGQELEDIPKNRDETSEQPGETDAMLEGDKKNEGKKDKSKRIRFGKLIRIPRQSRENKDDSGDRKAESKDTNKKTNIATNQQENENNGTDEKQTSKRSEKEDKGNVEAEIAGVGAGPEPKGEGMQEVDNREQEVTEDKMMRDPQNVTNEGKDDNAQNEPSDSELKPEIDDSEKAGKTERPRKGKRQKDKRPKKRRKNNKEKVDSNPNGVGKENDTLHEQSQGEQDVNVDDPDQEGKGGHEVQASIQQTSPGDGSLDIEQGLKAEKPGLYEQQHHRNDKQTDKLHPFQAMIEDRTKIPRNHIFQVENYTGDMPDEDRQRSIELLDFVLHCLDLAERNAHFMAEQQKEQKEVKQTVAYKFKHPLSWFRK